MIRLLAISGSLREHSSNTNLLRALISLVPEGVEVVLFSGLGELPYFNPDLDHEPFPPAVTEFRAQVASADGVLICSPEYAHGVPGVLKNALDWLVSSSETVGKPFALLNASPRSTYAQASLHEILTTMAARVSEIASVTVPLLGSSLDTAGIVAHPEISATLRAAMLAFVEGLGASPSFSGRLIPNLVSLFSP